jgi:hypothetical protein
LQRAFNPHPPLCSLPLSLYNKTIQTDKERGKEKTKTFSKEHPKGKFWVGAKFAHFY